MRIGIDARLIEETGVGRYIRNLVAELEKIDTKNLYVLFLRKKQFESLQTRFEKRLADVPWHSVTEQFVMPAIYVKERLDLLHVPYFNIPIFYPGKMIATIHDLTILHVDTGKASTHPWILYKLRRLGYRLILSVGLRRAKKIIAVSETTKNDVVQSTGIDPEKIAVTYEGVNLKKSTGKPLVSGEYFLYVGNAYPHKNLDVLLKTGVRVIYAGKDDYFYRRLGITPMTVTDEELANLYQHAKALVFPSFMEGFGLPALEALSLGCPVICSDIPVFHEIIGDNAIYFNPKDPEDLKKKLTGEIVRKKIEVNKKYNWRTMATKTAQIYESSARI